MSSLRDGKMRRKVTRSQTDFGAQPTSYLMSSGDFITGVGQSGREADHSSPPIAEFKKS